MKNTIQKFFRYLSYLYNAGHIVGHGIHSPFAFHLINTVFCEKNPYYAYKQIENNRKFVCKKYASSKKYDQLSFRLINLAKPANIIEIGNSSGITTAYLASPHKKTPCFLFKTERENLSQKILESCQVFHVQECMENFDEALPNLLKTIETADCVYFHSKQIGKNLFTYFNRCTEKVTDKSLYIFEDIHHSKEIENAWKKIIQDEKVRVSFDLFSIGIIYFNSELQKQDYICLF